MNGRNGGGFRYERWWGYRTDNSGGATTSNIDSICQSFSTAGGIWGAQLTNLFLKEKINPLIGAAGVSAVPMSARVVQKLGQKENPRNFLLMHAMGPNMAGAVATSVVAGILLGMLL